MGFSGNGYYTVLKIEQNHINLFTLQSELDGLVMRSLPFGIQGVESYQVCLPLLLVMHAYTAQTISYNACLQHRAVCVYHNNALLYAGLT